MKKFFSKTFINRLIVTGILLAVVPAHARNEGVEVIVTDPYAEMRTGPGRGFPIFHVVEKNDQILIYKRYTDWYKVKTEGGEEGYIKREQLLNTLGPDGNEIDFSIPGWQDYVKRRWELGILAGDFSGADSFTGYIGYHFTYNIAAELKYTQTFSPVALNELIGLNIIHQPFPEWKLSPYIMIGAGNITISPSSSSETVPDREDSYMLAGGGVNFYVSRRFLWKIEYNDYTILTTRESNQEVDEWKAGFSIFF